MVVEGVHVMYGNDDTTPEVVILLYLLAYYRCGCHYLDIDIIVNEYTPHYRIFGLDSSSSVGVLGWTIHGGGWTIHGGGWTIQCVNEIFGNYLLNFILHEFIIKY